ncbi:MAG: glycosyltransferase family 2 protein [Pseudomonadota bacterium]
MQEAPGQDLTITVAILNHRRPDLLPRALAGVSQLDHPAFEIVVVGDQPELGSYRLPEWLATQVNYVHFAEPNICRARNHAIRAARGEIVAFIDDDAVPEPTWLRELTVPFTDPNVAAVGGGVRSSDGITMEWQGGTFDRSGNESYLEISEDATVYPAEHQRSSGRYLSLRGVNSAFRRSTIMQVGGFDEAIRYYLDETDLALRLADAGWSAALARRAEVHHLLIPNATRGLLRKPGNQHEIGAAKAHFCKKHLRGDPQSALDAFLDRRITMLDPQMRLGIVRTGDRNKLTEQLTDGFRDGLNREAVHPLKPDTPGPFAPFHPRTANVFHIAIETGWHPETNAALLEFGSYLAKIGQRVSHFGYRSGAHPPRVTYRDGMWHHRGGTWTLPDRQSGALAISRKARSAAERTRIQRVRRFDCILSARTSDDGAQIIELPGSRQKIAMQVQEGFSGKEDIFAMMLQSVADSYASAQNTGKDAIGRLDTEGLVRTAS